MTYPDFVLTIEYSETVIENQGYKLMNPKIYINYNSVLNKIFIQITFYYTTTWDAPNVDLWAPIYKIQNPKILLALSKSKINAIPFIDFLRVNSQMRLNKDGTIQLPHQLGSYNDMCVLEYYIIE